MNEADFLEKSAVYIQEGQLEKAQIILRRMLTDNPSHPRALELSGDLALKKVAEMLLNRMRETDIVARFGGEEFCILAPNMDKKHAQRIFDSIREMIASASIDIGREEPINITISIGVATIIGEVFEDMINRADVFLYQAKQTGRNKVVLES